MIRMNARTVLACYLAIQHVFWPVHGIAEEISTIAVLNFTNSSGDPQFDPLQESIAEALVTDLANRGGLQLVERSRLKALVMEIKLGMTGVIDEEQAARMGEQLGAKRVVLGSFSVHGDRIELNARIVDVGSGQISHGEQIEGNLEAQGELVRKLGGRLWAYWTGKPIPSEGKAWYARWWVWMVLVLAGGGAAVALGGGSEGASPLPDFPPPPQD